MVVPTSNLPSTLPPPAVTVLFCRIRLGAALYTYYIVLASDEEDCRMLFFGFSSQFGFGIYYLYRRELICYRTFIDFLFFICCKQTGRILFAMATQCLQARLIHIKSVGDVSSAFVRTRYIASPRDTASESNILHMSLIDAS